METHVRSAKRQHAIESVTAHQIDWSAPRTGGRSQGKRDRAGPRRGSVAPEGYVLRDYRTLHRPTSSRPRDQYVHAPDVSDPLLGQHYGPPALSRRPQTAASRQLAVGTAGWEGPPSPLTPTPPRSGPGGRRGRAAHTGTLVSARGRDGAEGSFFRSVPILLAADLPASRPTTAAPPPTPSDAPALHALLAGPAGQAEILQRYTSVRLARPARLAPARPFAPAWPFAHTDLTLGADSALGAHLTPRRRRRQALSGFDLGRGREAAPGGALPPPPPPSSY